MPDIGLLQAAPRHGGLPGIPLPSRERVELAAPAVVAAAAIAERFAAAPDAAILVHQVSTPPDTPSPVTPAPPSGSLSRPLPPSIRARDLFWLALALLVIIGTGVGIRDPWPADEPRFAAIARDMVATGEWLFPRVGGDLYQDKPPLFFWLLAVCYSLTGSIKWSFLLPSLAAAGGTLFLIYDLGRRLVSRDAGLAAALLTVCTLHFVMTMRGAQIDPTLCFLTTFSLYCLLRHLLLGPEWRWYAVGGFVAGLGVITKGVGFLPMLILIPFFLMRGFGWRGLATLDSGAVGWKWLLAPVAMLVAVSLWFVPMLVAVHASGAPEYAAYRDEILFKQTVGRYAASWHHVKAWYFFIVEIVPVLWLPWSALLFWLVPRFRNAFRERDARVWLPLFWMLTVLAVLLVQPGKTWRVYRARAAGAGRRRLALHRGSARPARCASRGLSVRRLIALGRGSARGSTHPGCEIRRRAHWRRQPGQCAASVCIHARVRGRAGGRLPARAAGCLARGTRFTRVRILVLDRTGDEWRAFRAAPSCIPCSRR